MASVLALIRRPTSSRAAVTTSLQSARLGGHVQRHVLRNVPQVRADADLLRRVEEFPNLFPVEMPDKAQRQLMS